MIDIMRKTIFKMLGKITSKAICLAKDRTSGVWGGEGGWGEEIFIYWDLGSTGYNFRGAGKQAHIFWGFREPCQKVKNKLKNLTERKSLQCV